MSEKIKIENPKLEYAIKHQFNIIKDGDSFHPEGFVNLDLIKKVKSLFISGLGISNFKELPYFTELEELDISNNPLVEVDLSNLKKLKSLSCYSQFGNIIYVKDVASNLNSVDCNIEQILSFNHLNIQSLTITSTYPLISIPEIIFEFKNLESLDVSFCGINSIKGIEKLTKLKFLDLSRNQIETVPNQITGLKLTCLRLDKNPINYLSEDLIDSFKVIREMTFGQISKEDENWEEQGLYLSHRSISDEFLHRNDDFGKNEIEIVHEWLLEDLVVKLNEKYKSEIPHKIKPYETGMDGLPF